MLVDLLHHSLPALIQPNVNEAYRAGHNRDRHGGQAKVQSQVRADNKEREAGFEFGELQIGLTLMNNETQRLDKTLFILQVSFTDGPQRQVPRPGISLFSFFLRQSAGAQRLKQDMRLRYESHNFSGVAEPRRPWYNSEVPKYTSLGSSESFGTEVP